MANASVCVLRVNTFPVEYAYVGKVIVSHVIDLKTMTIVI